MDLSCLPAAVQADLMRAGIAWMPPDLSAALAQWERLAEPERETAAAKVRLMAGLAR